MNDLSRRRRRDFPPESLELGAFYRTIFAEPELAVYVLRIGTDGSVRFEDANDGVARLAGRPVEDIRGRAPLDCLPLPVADCLETHLRDCLDSKRSLTYQRSLDLPGGRVSWKTMLMPVVDDKDGIRHVVGLTRDITHEMEMQGLAEQSQALLHRLSAALPSAIYLFNVKNRTIRFLGGDVGPERRAWRRRAEEAGSRANEMFTHPEDVTRLNDRIGHLARLRDGEVTTISFRILVPDGEYRRFECRETVFSRDGAGAVEYILGISDDVSEQARMQEEVRTLSDRLLTLQIDERRRIAEELHDSTAQHLTAAGLALTRITGASRHVDRESERTIDDALDDARRSLQEATQEIRVLAYLLHPPLLQSFGFGEAIRSFATGFAGRAGLAIEVRTPDEPVELDDETSRHMYRICQEALANVHRHAKATSASVVLAADEEVITLTVQDNGIGFDEASVASEVQLGVGILGMRERMKRIGGSIQFRSNTRGTTLTATAPRAGVRQADVADAWAAMPASGPTAPFCR